MPACPVCGADESREELVEEVFQVDERYVAVDRIPARVCGRCGERTFSRGTTERIRRIVHGPAEPTRSVALGVFEFTQGERV